MFFTFYQNNSGGSFTIDEAKGIGKEVIIEALNSEDANALAVARGLYFNGVGCEIDCGCCGDRWSECHGDGSPFPKIFEQNVTDGVYPSPFRPWDEAVSFVHYLDGRVVRIGYRFGGK